MYNISGHHYKLIQIRKELNVYAAVKKYLNVLPALMKCKISTGRVSNKMSLQLLKVSTIGTQLFGDVPVKQIRYSA
jgi:hypothetical protein